MGRTPRELGAALGADELTEFGALYALEPWGCAADDWRAGMLAAAVVNSQRGKGRAAQPADFIPDRERPGGRRSPAEIMAAMGVLRAQQGG